MRAGILTLMIAFLGLTTVVVAEPRVSGSMTHSREDLDFAKPENPIPSMTSIVRGFLNRFLGHSKLYERVHQSRFEEKDETTAQLQMAAMKVDSRRTDSHAVRSAWSEGTVAAFSDEMSRNSELVRQLTEGMNFRLDLADLWPFSSSRTAAETSSANMVAVAGNSQHSGEQCSQENPSVDKVAGRDYALPAPTRPYRSPTKFNGKLVPHRAAGGGMPDFTMSLQQEAGYYQLDWNLSPSAKDSPFLHRMHAPVWGTLGVSRTFDNKGEAQESSLNGLLMRQDYPELNLNYNHGSESLSSALKVQRHNDKLSVNAALPSEWQPRQGVAEQGSEYSISYERSL